METTIKLITRTFEKDDWRNEIAIEKETTVFARERSINRSEFYQAAQSRLNISHIFELSSYLDYSGEEIVEYTDRTGRTMRLRVIKTYQAPDGDALELTCGEAINP